jgi:hypothetical protein
VGPGERSSFIDEASMSQSTRGERITAAVSALAAIIILGAAVTAQQSRTSPVNSLARLESDLRFQLYMAYRTDGGRLSQSVGELNRTLDAWQRSPRTAADDRLLAQWLEDSIRRSMPGELKSLPATPQFGALQLSAAATPPDAHPTTPQLAPAPTLARPAPSNRPEPTQTANAQAALAMPETAEPAVNKAPVESLPKPAVAEAAVAAEESIVAKAVEPATQPRAESNLAPVEVNLAELNSRIAGYHQGLDGIKAALVAAGESLDQQQLVMLVDRLESLADQYQFVCLYYDALTERERSRVAAPRPMRPTVELVDRQCARVEHRDSGDFLAAFEVPAGSLADSPAARLKAIADRLDAEQLKPHPEP